MSDVYPFAGGFGRVWLCLGLLLAAALVRDARAQDPAPVPNAPLEHPEKYHLAWHDEFDGNALDLTKWDYRTDTRGLSVQLPDSVTVADGHLIINLRKEHRENTEYVGGGVISKEKFTHGYYEARMKCPASTGWHTSFWMMAFGKPDQEVDVCEHDSADPAIYSVNMHDYRLKQHSLGEQRVKAPDLSADFHVFGCDYEAERVTFYLDGKEVGSRDIKDLKQGPQNIWATSIAWERGGVLHALMAKPPVPGTAVFDYVRYFSTQE